MSVGPTEIGAVLGAAKTGYELLKTIGQAVTKAQYTSEAVEIMKAITDLGAMLTEMNAAVAALYVENQELKRQLQAPADLEEFKKRYPYEETVCWKHDDAGKRIDGPFCPNCVDEGSERRLNPGTLTHLLHFAKQSGGNLLILCNSSGTGVEFAGQISANRLLYGG